MRKITTFEGLSWMTLAGVIGAILVLEAGCGKVYEAEEASRTFEIPAGAELMVTPTQPVDIAEAEVGQLFSGVLELPLVMEETVIAPRGAPVAGEFVASPGTEGEGEPSVGITLTSLTIHGGEEAALQTAPVFPPVRTADAEQPAVREDAVLMFVLTAPAEARWAMDPVEAGQS
jgi:hypothetical protein